MVRRICLDHHISLKLPAPGPPGCLSQELKGTLCALIVRCIEGEIRCHDTHKGHTREVMTLYDHLGPNENIRPALCEGGEDFFMSPFFCRGVRIHS